MEVGNPGARLLVVEARVAAVDNPGGVARAEGVGNRGAAALVAAPAEAEVKVVERAEPSRQLRCRSSKINGIGFTCQDPCAPSLCLPRFSFF